MNERDLISKMAEALRESVITIKNWHGINAGPQEKALWKLYQESPEMKKINQALALAERYLEGNT